MREEAAPDLVNAGQAVVGNGVKAGQLHSKLFLWWHATPIDVIIKSWAVPIVSLPTDKLVYSEKVFNDHIISHKGSFEIVMHTFAQVMNILKFF